LVATALSERIEMSHDFRRRIGLFTSSYENDSRVTLLSSNARESLSASPSAPMTRRPTESEAQ
jgi:hypothetical protein